jgi:hypothetical protein
MLMALLGVFAATYPATRAADITFVARPNEEKDDLSVPTKPTPAPTTYSFSGSPSPNSWSFYGDQACSVSMSATVRGKTVQPKHFGGYIDVGTGVVDIFETEFSGRLVPTSTAAGQLVTAPWHLFAWDHTIKIVTDPAYISVNTPTGGANALTREGDVSTTLTSRIPETRIGIPSWTASPAEGLSFNPSQGETTTITNATAATGRWVTVTALSQKKSPFSGTVTSTSRVAVVDVNISSSTVAEKDEESAGVVVPILPATATSGGTPLSLSISPTNSLSGAVKLERSSCNFDVYSDAALNTSLFSGTQTTVTYASASSLPSSPVYLKGVTSSTGTDSTDTLTLTFTPSAQTGGSNPSPFKDKIKITTGKIEIAMDGDRNGTINFDSSNDSHYLFWVNNDVDVISDGEEDDNESGTANCNDDVITCKRDLEDFARLHIKVDNKIATLSGITYFLKFENVTSQESPSINIFEAVDASSAYLSNPDVALSQSMKPFMLVVTTAEQQLCSAYINASNQVSPFIFEGKSVGKGDLTLIVKKDGSEICRKSIALDLRPITEFYEKYVVDAGSDDAVNSTSNQVGTCTYTPENNQYVLYVHGWNMAGWEKDRWAETVFKRLWWQGYKGRVGCFQWPTYTGTLTYDASELRAWRSGQSLSNRITTLNASYSGQVRVLAHSMGNVVMGEALRLFTSQVVHTYIAAQAAMSAHCYDNTIDNYWNDFNTPNIYACYSSGLSPDTPYLSANSNHAGAMVLYFNPVDYALSSWWETNNEYKPDFPDYHYTEGDNNTHSYNPGSGDRFYYDSPLPLDERTMTIPDNRFEIFARCAESRSRALGTQAVVGGFGTTRNLQDWGYNNAHYSHSREFRSNIADEWSFWSVLFGDASLTR